MRNGLKGLVNRDERDEGDDFLRAFCGEEDFPAKTQRGKDRQKYFIFAIFRVFSGQNLFRVFS